MYVSVSEEIVCVRLRGTGREEEEEEERLRVCGIEEWGVEWEEEKWEEEESADESVEEEVEEEIVGSSGEVSVSLREGEEETVVKDVDVNEGDVTVGRTGGWEKRWGAPDERGKEEFKKREERLAADEGLEGEGAVLLRRVRGGEKGKMEKR